MSGQVTIVDYGMGNLWSVQSAVDYCGATSFITANPLEVLAADCIILPGVGSFFSAMSSLHATGLADALREAVLERQTKILGICLGMQLFAEAGTEDGESEGLGFMPGKVERFKPTELNALKVPHIGFNAVHPDPGSRLFRGIPGPVDCYFVHSYRLVDRGGEGLYATCRYGMEFVAGYEHNHIFATQFHPEKSQTNGLRMLQNFLSI